jgi:hypothetical protein
MDLKVRRGFFRHMLPVPVSFMKKGVEKGREKIAGELAFMTREHRRINHFIVREMPLYGGGPWVRITLQEK